MSNQHHSLHIGVVGDCPVGAIHQHAHGRPKHREQRVPGMGAAAGAAGVSSKHSVMRLLIPLHRERTSPPPPKPPLAAASRRRVRAGAGCGGFEGRYGSALGPTSQAAAARARAARARASTPKPDAPTPHACTQAARHHEMTQAAANPCQTPPRSSITHRSALGTQLKAAWRAAILDGSS